MKNKEQKKCEEEACCAHRRVIYKRIDNADGTCSDSWVCDLNCGAKFYPVHSTPTESTMRCLIQSCRGKLCLPHCPCDCHSSPTKPDTCGSEEFPEATLGKGTGHTLKPDHIVQTDKMVPDDSWEKNLIRLLCDVFKYETPTVSQGGKVLYFIRQEKEKSYQEGKRSVFNKENYMNIEEWDKHFNYRYDAWKEIGRHSAYREIMEDISLQEYLTAEKLLEHILSKLKERLKQE